MTADPAIVLIQVTNRQARIRGCTAERSEGKAEQEGEDYRHKDQEQKSLEVTPELQQVLQGNV